MLRGGWPTCSRGIASLRKTCANATRSYMHSDLRTGGEPTASKWCAGERAEVNHAHVDRLEVLARELEVGQLQPVLVDRSPSGGHPAVEGEQRILPERHGQHGRTRRL